MRHAAITGWGMAVPEGRLTNADLERMVDTSDEWIVSRTGIKERRVVGPGDSTTSLSVAAARAALARAGLRTDEIDLIVVATCTPDQLLGSQASLVQAELGGTAGAFDLGAACSGFVYALAVGSQFVRGGLHDRVLVIGADTLTRFLDYTDRTTCILFGDGAGAVVLEATDQPRGLLSTVLGADGSGYKHLYIPGWDDPGQGSAARAPGVRPFLRMNGPEVFRFAVRVMGEAAAEAVERAGLSFADVDMLIPHQANVRIIDAAARRLALPREKVWVNLDRYGNTSAASIPIALVEAEAAGRLHEADDLVLVAFGGGLSWAAGVLRWGVAGARPDPARGHGHDRRPAAEGVGSLARANGLPPEPIGLPTGGAVGR